MSKSSFICVILCGVLVACLPRLVAPSDSYISDSLNPVATDNEFDLFPPFQPVYLDFYTPLYVIFSVSVPLEPNSFDFSWSYSLGGSSFTSVDDDDFFVSFDNYLFIDNNSNHFMDLRVLNTAYFKCDVFEKDSDTLVHTYYFSYQFFNLPSLQNNSPSAALKVVESQDKQLQGEHLQGEQPQEEQPQEEQPQEEQPQEEIEGGEDGE